MRGFTFLELGLLAASAADVAAHGGHKKRSTPPSLNPQLTNTLPNARGGPTLYYNGSGPVPPYDETSPAPAPITPYSTADIETSVVNEIVAIAGNNSAYGSTCAKCMASTEIMHVVAITQPVSVVTNILIRLCNTLKYSIYSATCENEYAGVGGQGAYLAQLFAKQSATTGDFQAYCFYNYKTDCEAPAVVEIDESKYFTPKPAKATVAPPPSGESINVLHISDWHLDPRYDIGSEADCSQYLCCRPYSTNTKNHTTSANPLVPASRFGYLYCDTPADLAISSFDSMHKFFGGPKNVSFAIFTGDIVSHDNDDQLSRAYIEYEEKVTYETFKAQMGNTPIYPTLGNHDSLPEAYNTPNSINPPSGNIFSWNYDLLSSMWQSNGWIDGAEANYASTHYGAYAHTTAQGLRIISFNSDFLYTDNIFNYFNFSNPDNSGVLSFVAQELAAAEARGQRAWLISHVLSGYDGSNALPNPSALLQSIVNRYSPATIAGVFFGHTHEDQLQIFYDYKPSSLTPGTQLRNTTDVDYTKPLMVGYIGPSITPLTGNNAGYQLYQVDAKTFEVTGIQTYFANVSESLSWTTEPVWRFEYDSRDVYASSSSSSGGSYGSTTWPASAPLNATFWHGVTERMLADPALVATYNFFETKSSVVTKPCNTPACAAQKVCYIRSGSAALGAKCPKGAGPF